VTMTTSPFFVHCPSCSSQFPVDPDKVPLAGVHAICSACMRVFHVAAPPAGEGLTDGSSSWMREGGAATVPASGLALDAVVGEGMLEVAPDGIGVDDASPLEGDALVEGDAIVEARSPAEDRSVAEDSPFVEDRSLAEDSPFAEDGPVVELESSTAAPWIDADLEAETLPEVEVADDIRAHDELQAADELEVAGDFEVTGEVELANSPELADELAVADYPELTAGPDVADGELESLDGEDREVLPQAGGTAEWALEDPEGADSLEVSPPAAVRGVFDIGDDLDGGTHLLIDEDFEEPTELGNLEGLVTLEEGEDSEASAEVDLGPLDDLGPIDTLGPVDGLGTIDDSTGSVELDPLDEGESLAGLETTDMVPEPMEASEPARPEVVPDGVRDEPPGYQDLTSLAQEALAEGPGAGIGEGMPTGSAGGGATLASGAPRFGRRDPSERARHLARVLVSDIIAYHPERYRESFAQGTLQEDFRAEVDKSWKEYVDQVGIELAESTPFFREALNDVLGQGRHLF